MSHKKVARLIRVKVTFPTMSQIGPLSVWLSFVKEMFSGLTRDVSFVRFFSIVGFFNCSLLCCPRLCVHSSFAILMGKRERESWLLCLVYLSGVS